MNEEINKNFETHSLTETDSFPAGYAATLMPPTQATSSVKVFLNTYQQHNHCFPGIKKLSYYSQKSRLT